MFETADKSRRFFAPADLEALAALEGQAKDGLADLTRRRAVLPPAIEVGRFPRLTSAAVFTIEGAAVHPVRIRDVVVLVRPPGAAAVERKVHYESATGDVKRLPFTAQVPLEPGGNRVTILARDGAKVQHRRDLWVYRDAE
jgi:carboxyl-terminal processing protease